MFHTLDKLNIYLTLNVHVYRNYWRSMNSTLLVYVFEQYTRTNLMLNVHF